RALETPQKALKHCIEINRYENDSDRLCRTLIAQLFDEEQDPVQIIKWKEIFEVIEPAVDKCEDVANVIDGVILQSAGPGNSFTLLLIVIGLTLTFDLSNGWH